MAYISIRKFDRMKRPFKSAPFWWPMLYFSRWLRLTPVVMFGIVMAWKVIPTFLGDETPRPIAEFLGFELETCKKYWYLYFLYIVTLKKSYMDAPRYAIACMGHLWYLSSEFQMVWFTPIIFLGYLANKYFGIFLSFVGLVVGLASSANVSADNFHGDPGDQMFTYYLRALPRCGAYFIGFGVGLTCYTIEKHFKTKKWGRPRMNVWLSSALQVLACSILLFWLQYPHTDQPGGRFDSDTPWTEWQNHMWTVWSRPGWATGLSILCASLLYGPQKGLIAGFLNWKFWAPMAKLSFAGYVLHFPIFYLRILYTPMPEAYTPGERLHLFLGHSCIATFAAFCCWFLVEAPFAVLAKLFVTWLTSLVMGKTKSRNGKNQLSKDDQAPRAMRQKTNEGVLERPRQKTNDGSGEAPKLGPQPIPTPKGPKNARRRHN